MELIRDFKNLTKADAALAGGKGASLGEMTQAGIPVPPGFVILAPTFDRFIREAGLTAEIQSMLESVNHKEINTVENASEKIKSLILKVDIPVEIITEIQKSFHTLNSTYVAVRSSATAEDGADHAWAGQLDSYLNVTEAKLLDSVKKCWASLFTPRAIFYRFEKGLDTTGISVAVVVQKMVESEKSGIAFSVHPVTEDPNQLIIEAGLGLGESIVSGQITPDSYVVQKDPREIIDITLNHQTKGLYRSADGGNEWKELDAAVSGQVLSREQILELSSLIVDIESHYNFPCDIEWAYEQGKFYIVQSRPITTLSNKKASNLPPIPNLDDYQQLFEVGGMPFLISDIWSEHYRNLQCLLLFTNNTWTSFLPKTVIQKTLREGLDILSSKDVFTKYNQDFDQYKSASSKFFDNLIGKETATKSDILEFFKFASALFIFYSKTEFFYTDQAFLESKNNTILKSSLSTMEQTKNSGREYLNKIFFGSESIYNRLLKILEKQYQIKLEKLNGYSRDEILALFDNKKVSPAIINNRLRSYVMLTRDKIFLKFEGDMAESIITNLIKPADSNTEIIRGTCANTGQATGVATVMLFGYHDFDELHHKIAAMKQGEILIAETTSPEFMLACQKAGAIVTNQGGLLSHAAIVSRELGIPCVVGTGNATKAFQTGDLVEVDADNGIVKIIKKHE